jgi:hypothetical protein
MPVLEGENVKLIEVPHKMNNKKIHTPIGNATVECTYQYVILPNELLYLIFPEDTTNTENKGKETGRMLKRFRIVMNYRNPDSAVYVVHKVNYDIPVEITNDKPIVTNDIPAEFPNNYPHFQNNDNTIEKEKEKEKKARDYRYRSVLLRSDNYLFETEIQECDPSKDKCKGCEFKAIIIDKKLPKFERVEKFVEPIITVKPRIIPQRYRAMVVGGRTSRKSKKRRNRKSRNRKSRK